MQLQIRLSWSLSVSNRPIQPRPPGASREEGIRLSPSYPGAVSSMRCRGDGAVSSAVAEHRRSSTSMWPYLRVCSQSSGGHGGHRDKPGTSSTTQYRSLSASDACLLVLKAEQQGAKMPVVGVAGI